MHVSIFLYYDPVTIGAYYPVLYFLTILLLSFPSETYTNIYAIPASPRLAIA